MFCQLKKGSIVKKLAELNGSYRTSSIVILRGFARLSKLNLPLILSLTYVVTLKKRRLEILNVEALADTGKNDYAK